MFVAYMRCADPYAARPYEKRIPVVSDVMAALSWCHCMLATCYCPRLGGTHGEAKHTVYYM